MKKFIIGIDVSKLKLDLHCYGQSNSLIISNDDKGFKALLRWLRMQVSKDFTLVMVVMEYTGIYTYGIERFLAGHGINYVKRPALDIKRSVGMVRGKSDKADACLISKYGWMRKEQLTPMQPISESQLELQQWMSHRDKLVADRASYQSKLKELRSQMQDKVNRKMTGSMEYIMEVLTIEIREAEQQIKALISSDSELQNNYELVSSVTGIGFATAVHLLIATENFTRFEDARKLICYCGVAPFEHSSGSSIRGKTRVSQLANKKLKSLLTMAALSAIKHDPDMKLKYEQKIKEGKAKMSAINTIRAKLIERVFAVVKRKSAYKVRLAA